MNKTKKIITEAAIKIFSTAGYKGATMDEIALEAKVAKGTLYYNFNSKEEIFNYIIQEGISHLREEVRETRESNLSPIIKLKNICKIQLTYFYKNKDFVKVILSQLWGSDERQNILRCIIKEYVDDIKVIMDQGVKEKLIDDVDTLVLAHAFFGTFTSIAIYDLITTDKENLDIVIDITLKFALRGIGLQST